MYYCKNNKQINDNTIDDNTPFYYKKNTALRNNNIKNFKNLILISCNHL